MKDKVSIALPKGRILEELWPILTGAGIIESEVDLDSRRLIFTLEKEGLELILAKPVDVPTYVEFGAADMGITGKDVLLEAGCRVGELLDLGISTCDLVVAVPESSAIESIYDFTSNSRIATKYPVLTESYFSRFGCQIEIIKLNGSIELGPIIGLADAIVDITETGRTLVENRLRIVDYIQPSSARLIVNPFSFKVKLERINQLLQQLGEAVEDTNGAEGRGQPSISG